MNRRSSWKWAVLSHIAAEVGGVGVDRLFTYRAFVGRHLTAICEEVGCVGWTPERTLSRVLQNLRDEGVLKFYCPGPGGYMFLAEGYARLREREDADSPTYAMYMGCASAGERIVAQILTDIGIRYEPQKRIPDLRDIQCLPLDFYFERGGAEFVIEYDGTQHEFPVPHWDGADVGGFAPYDPQRKDGFALRQEHDRIKEEYCWTSGFELLRIPAGTPTAEIRAQILAIIAAGVSRARRQGLKNTGPHVMDGTASPAPSEPATQMEPKMDSPSSTKVISLKGRPDKRLRPGEVYVGRRIARGGWDLPASKWMNPFPAGEAPADRALSIIRYRLHLEQRPDLMGAIHELRGKILACWCAPAPCHADVLRQFADGGVMWPGRIAVGRLPHRFGGPPGESRKCRGRSPLRPQRKKWPIIDGFHNVNVCSSSTRLWRDLSPMKLGPVEFTEIMPDGARVARTATCVENLWQAIKVERAFQVPDSVGYGGPRERMNKIMSGGPPVPEWWVRRDRVWADPRPHRHVIKKEDQVNPDRAVCWWNGRYYSYADARVIVYIAVYSDLVRATHAFDELRDMVARGHDVHILGYDGRPIESHRGLVGMLKDDTRPFGHELVLASILTHTPL